MTSNSLVIKTIKNISYNTLAKSLAFISLAVANIILSRNLSSSDYGIFGFAWIFIGFLSRFNDLGINSAVVQKSELAENQLYTAFCIKAFLGITLFLITFFAAAPLAPLFFDEKAIKNVIRVLSLSFLINIFSFLPSSLLVRELNYKRLSLAEIGSVIINSVVAITLALSGFKYWSIVIANLAAPIGSVVILNSIKRVKIRIAFDKLVAKGMLNYGLSLFGTGIIVFAIFNADNFIIGSVKGSVLLGYYAIAFNWGSMICTVLYGMVLSILFPTFSRIQRDTEVIKSSYLKVLEYISFIGILGNITLFIISKDFLFFILGHNTEKWFPALNALRIFCFYGIIRSLLEPLGSVIMAVGRPQLLLKACAIAAIIELAFIYPALKYFGIEGVAVVVTFAYFFQYIIYYPFLREEMNISGRDLLRSVKPAILSAIVLLAVYFYFEHMSFRNTVILMFVKMVVIVFAYSLAHGVLTKWTFLKEVRTMAVAMKNDKGKMGLEKW